MQRRRRGIKSSQPIVGSNWNELSEEGWRWVTNLPVLGVNHAAADALERIINQYGRDNVTTGNAWNESHAWPSGVPGMIGVYAMENI